MCKYIALLRYLYVLVLIYLHRYRYFLTIEKYLERNISPLGTQKQKQLDLSLVVRQVAVFEELENINRSHWDNWKVVFTALFSYQLTKHKR